MSLREKQRRYAYYGGIIGFIIALFFIYLLLLDSTGVFSICQWVHWVDLAKSNKAKDLIVLFIPIYAAAVIFGGMFLGWAIGSKAMHLFAPLIKIDK